MSSFNRVIILGNLTRDPELRYTPKGSAVAKIGLAVNRKYKVGEESKEEVTFIDCEAWAKAAETIAQYCKKGSSLLVEGRLRTEEWEDKNTHQKRSKLGVVIENFQFVGGKAERPAQAPASAPAATGAEDDGSVPF
jgi:single-strand DNA-binding protein